MRRALRTAAAWGAAALMAAGCGAPSADDAVTVAEDWVAAVADREFEAACDVMAPSAERALVAKYVPDTKGAPCEAVVEAYARALPDRKLAAIREGGLEYNGEIKEDRLGVFPVAAPYELEVILMERGDGGWRVASPALGVGG